MKKPTFNDIARIAGVSTATVSRALNGSTSVSPTIQKRVESAAHRLKYSRSIRTGRKNRIIGLAIPNMLNPFFPLLIKGIESIARTRDWNIILSDSEDSTESESLNIKRFVDIDIRGIIIIPSGGSADAALDLIRERFPILFADRTVQGHDSVCSVTADNEEGAYQAVKYLINLGHQRIAHIAGSQNLSTERERFQGYRKAMLEHSLEIDEGLVLTGGYHFETAYEEVKRLIDGGKGFSAIFAANDVMAFGALLAFKERGIPVPARVSIIGYDNIPFASLIGLTTVAQPAFEMGRNAMLMLLDLIEGREPNPRKMLLRPSMVIRDTCMRIEAGR
jgi:LacI family transcriptional regulator